MLERVACSVVVAVVTMLVSLPAHADGEAPRVEGPTVRVHVVAWKAATLERLDSSPVCSAPCDVDVALDGVYRVRLDGALEPSAPFRLQPRTGAASLRLKVLSPSPSAGSEGKGLAIAGAIGVGIGGLLIGSGASQIDTDTSAVFFLGLLGGVTALAGLASVIVGAALLATNSTEPSVEQTSSVARVTVQRVVGTPFGFAF